MINLDMYKLPEDIVCKRLTTVREVDGLTWIPGRGNLNADVMVVSLNPTLDGVTTQQPLTGFWYAEVADALKPLGLTPQDVYITNGVKHSTLRGAKPTAKMHTQGLPVLLDEIKRVKPKVILTINAEVFSTLAGKSKVKASIFTGTYADLPGLPGIRVYPAPNPSQFTKQPLYRKIFHDTFKAATDYALKGEDVSFDVTIQKVITNLEELRAFLMEVEIARIKRGKDSIGMMALDCEWQGDHWFHSSSYLRTLQLTDLDERTAVIKFYPGSIGVHNVPIQSIRGDYDEPPPRKAVSDSAVNVNAQYEGCVWIEDAMGMLKQYLEMGKTKICGHNIKEDGLWVYQYGLDLRPYIVYDTMLAEHCMCNLGPFGLTWLTLKYTNLGKYDRDLDLWKTESNYYNGKLAKEQFLLEPVDPDVNKRTESEAFLKTIQKRLVPFKGITERIAEGNRIIEEGNEQFNLNIAERIHPEDTTMLKSVAPKVRGFIKAAIDNVHPKPIKITNGSLLAKGYGAIPDEVLLKYGGADTVATMRILKAQSMEAEFQRVTQLRGHHKEYPSLLESTVKLSCNLWELELEGVPIDVVRMEELTRLYHGKMNEIADKLTPLVLALGWKEFKPKSSGDIKWLLFGPTTIDPEDKARAAHQGAGLGLTPICSAKNNKKLPSKDWGWVMRQSPIVRSAYSPATDAEVIKVLMRTCDSEILSLYADYSKLKSMCGTFLQAPASDDEFLSEDGMEEHGKGWNGYLCSDNRLHPSYGQLLATGRLSSQRPNVFFPFLHNCA